jgi:hypothetical protein
VRWLAVAFLLLAGCGGTRYLLAGAPAKPFDVLIVPGCPCEESGALSLCQKSRAVWAAILWERGWARNVIVSGSDVHSPHVEAEALAAGMAALGVPGERIYLEPNALHTDENMYDSLQIARALGLRTVAVASQGGHASGGCAMMATWGQPCVAIPVDLAAVKARAARSREALAAVRIRPSSRWRPLAEREHLLYLETGRLRPPSFLLYMFGRVMLEGKPWIPRAPARPPIVTWAERAGVSSNP